jgi:hypothetical protein
MKFSIRTLKGEFIHVDIDLNASVIFYIFFQVQDIKEQVKK